MIIGIAGTLGAGKGTVVEYLKKKGFAHYSSSAILKEILLERGLAATRQNMSSLANELATKYEGGILHLSQERAEKDGAKDYILESIHRVGGANYIHSIGGKLLGVDADIEKRYERIIKRGDGEKDRVTFEQFTEDSRREDEGLTGSGPNIRAVLKEADALLQNNGTEEELLAQAEEALSKLGYSK